MKCSAFFATFHPRRTLLIYIIVQDVTFDTYICLGRSHPAKSIEPLLTIKKIEMEKGDGTPLFAFSVVSPYGWSHFLSTLALVH